MCTARASSAPLSLWPRLPCRGAVVLAEDGAEGAADLADGGAGAERVLHRIEQVVGALGGGADARERGVDGGLVAPGAELPQPRDLEGDRLLVDAEDGRGGDFPLDVLVDADDRALAARQRLLMAVGLFGDGPLHEALLDRRDRAAALGDLGHERLGPRLELVGQRLDEVGPAERVG